MTKLLEREEVRRAPEIKVPSIKTPIPRKEASVKPGIRRIRWLIAVVVVAGFAGAMMLVTGDNGTSVDSVDISTVQVPVNQAHPFEPNSWMVDVGQVPVNQAHPFEPNSWD